MPVLWAYARDLFQTPGFGDTVDFDHIKRHYYEVHRDINPTGVVPLGPDLANWLTRTAGSSSAAARSATARPRSRRRRPSGSTRSTPRCATRTEPARPHMARRTAAVSTSWARASGTSTSQQRRWSWSSRSRG